MFKALFINLLFFFCALMLNAQTIPNLSFETWETSMPSGRYEEPTGWATGNQPVDLPTVPVTTNPTEKTTDAVDGTYAVKLETIFLLAEIASGTVFLGEFSLDIINPANSTRFGIPYSGRPYSLSGYYKYNALNSDSCDMYISLFNSNLNTSTFRGDTVAHAQIRSNTEVANYTPFELVLDYKSTAQVDTIQIVFASSAAGADLAGQIGAQLFIDGLVLNMEPTGIKHVLMPEVAVKVYPNPASDYLVLEMDKLLPQGKLEVFSSDGRLVLTQTVNEKNLQLDIDHLSLGNYHYVLYDAKGGAMSSGTFVVGE